MQSIYAFNKTQESNYYLGISQINERFKDALMFHGKDHKERLDEETINKIRTALGLKPLNIAVEEGKKITNKINSNVEKTLE